MHVAREGGVGRWLLLCCLVRSVAGGGGVAVRGGLCVEECGGVSQLAEGALEGYYGKWRGGLSGKARKIVVLGLGGGSG